MHKNEIKYWRKKLGEETKLEIKLEEKLMESAQTPLNLSADIFGLQELKPVPLQNLLLQLLMELCVAFVLLQYPTLFQSSLMGNSLILHVTTVMIPLGCLTLLQMHRKLSQFQSHQEDLTIVLPLHQQKGPLHLQNVHTGSNVSFDNLSPLLYQQHLLQL